MSPGIGRLDLNLAKFNEAVSILLTALPIFLDAPNNIEAGRVLLKINDGLIIKCGIDAISLLVTEPEFTANVGDYL